MRVTAIGLVEAAAVVTIAFSVVTVLPIDQFFVQLFTHFRLQYLGISLLLLAVFLRLQKPWFIGGIAVAVVINGIAVLPWYFGKDAPGAGTPLKVLHANVLSSNNEYERLFTLLAAEQPDVVMLQEISPDWLVELDELRADYPYSYAEARDGNFGIALFSRLPMTSVSHFDSPPRGHPTIVASIEVGQEIVRVIGTHAMIPVSGDFYEARNTQLRDIAERLGRQTGPRLLIGDLNLSQWDINYRMLERVSGLRNARQGFGVVPTWPVFMPPAMIPIDHVLVSDSVAVTDIHSGPRIGSDHLPLIVTLSL